MNRLIAHLQRFIRRAGLLACAMILSLANPHGIAQDETLFRSAFPLDSLRSVTQADAKVAAEVLICKIVQEQGYDYTTTIPKDHAEFLPAMLKDQYDFFLMFAYEYLNYRDQYAMTPRLLGVRDAGNPLNQFVLLTARGTGLEGLKGGRLLVERGSGNLPLLWLGQVLHEKGIADSPAQCFRSIKETHASNETVLPVFFGKAEAALVTLEAYDLIVELNPQIGMRLEKAAVSEPLLTTVMCTRDGFKEEPGVIERVSTSMHERPDGKQILTMMRVESLVRYEPAMMESLIRLVEAHRERESPAGNAEDLSSVSE